MLQCYRRASKLRNSASVIEADPAGVEILFVLPQGPVVWEQSLTANTMRHRVTGPGLRNNNQ